MLLLPIFTTNEYGLANYLIKLYNESHHPFYSNIELNNVLANLEGFSQKYYGRPLVNYEKYFEIIGQHYYLPNIMQELKDNADYITEEIEHAKFDQNGKFHVIKYPKISKDIMYKVDDEDQTFSDIKNTISLMLAHSPSILNTIVVHSTRGAVLKQAEFNPIKPNSLINIYNNYIYTLKTSALNTTKNNN